MSQHDPSGADASGTVVRDEDTLELLEDFLSETSDVLDTADESLIALERDGYDIERVHAVFRSFHSIKGVAGFLQLDDFARLSHATESVLNEVRSGPLSLAAPILELVRE